MADGLGMKVSKFLLQEEPKLLVADKEATVRVTSALAKVMGCLLATVLTRAGEATYIAVMKHLVMKIHENACGTANKAIEFAKVRDGLDSVH